MIVEILIIVRRSSSGGGSSSSSRRGEDQVDPQNPKTVLSLGIMFDLYYSISVRKYQK